MPIILQKGGNCYVISLQVLSKKKQKTTRVCQDLQPPTLAPLGPER